MADYYPLLAKAVVGLPDSTAEARHAIYERARGALFGQLRNLDPPVPEEAIEREAQALEVAVARLETEIASRSGTGSGAPAAEPDLAGLGPTTGSPAGTSPAHEPSAAPLPEPNPPDRDPLGPAPSAPVPIPSVQTPTPSRLLKVRRDPRPPGINPGARPDGAPRPGAAFNPMRPAPSARNPAPAARTAAKPSAARDEPQAPATGPASPGQTASSGRDFDAFAPAPAVPEAGALEAPAVEAPVPEALNPSPESSEPAARMRPEAQHPFAPRPARDAGPAKRLVVVGGIVGLVVALVAIAAYRLRDRPEDLVRPQPPPLSTQGEAGAGGKIVDRVGAGTATPGTAPALSGVPSSTADRNDAAKSGSGPANPPIPIARRAALLVEAPEEKSKVKTFLGTVIWRVDNVSTGPDEPLSMAVRAEIDIPEEKLQVAMTVQKNFDGTLPASHTMKLMFTEPQDGPLGNIKQISVLQMRREDSATGESLKGITVPVMENSFLVGLTRGDAEASNLDLLRSREWLDVPMVLANGHIAKLTFEKGPSGQRALDDAMASWQAR
ncbi:MAG: hypothetical protein M3178_15920 [Pseudomonadota bacterium]|nr:hypothetical protein [Pseudomonadota bacterium]